jgi:hypothetical protein
MVRRVQEPDQKRSPTGAADGDGPPSRSTSTGPVILDRLAMPRPPNRL